MTVPSGHLDEGAVVDTGHKADSPSELPTADPSEPSGPRGEPQPPRRLGCLPRLLVGLLAVLLTVAMLLVGAGTWAMHYVNTNLHHTDALTEYEGRPAESPGTNVLLTGVDTREGLDPDKYEYFEGSRADSLMILHVPESRGGQLSLVSVPRDSYVTIPAHTTAEGSQVAPSQNKINAAYAQGGAPLTTMTVETATGLHLDRYLEVRLAGLVEVVDAMGGIEVCLDEPFQDPHTGSDFPAGCQTMNGTEALQYVQARYSDPRGDLGRVERQQQVLVAILDKLMSPDVLLHPRTAKATLDAFLDAVTVDTDTGAWDLAWIARQIGRASRGSDAVGATVPVADINYSVDGVGSTVLWNSSDADRLFAALRADEPIPADLVTPPG